MGKVIKNVVKTVVATICGLLLAALVVPLAVSLAVSVPAVQNAIVKRLTVHLSERLGTKVAVDRVDIRLFNRVELRGFYVEDFGGDTLMYVPRLAAPVERLGLAGGPLAFGRVKLTGAQLWLRKARRDEDMNISRVVDAIRGGRPSNPDSRFRMTIAAIEADSLTFGLLRGDLARRAEGVDFSRFVISGAHASIDEFSISGDTIRMNISSLGGVERSGLKIDNLSVYPLLISRGSVALSDVGIRARGSELMLPAIRLVSEDREWDDFGEFTDSVTMGIEMRSSRVTTDLVGAFVPAVAGWGVVLDEVTLRTGGVLAELSADVESARTRGTTFSLDFTSRGLPYMETARFDARLRSLKSVGDDVAVIVRSITGKELARELSDVMARIGTISLTGGATGSLGDLTAEGALVSDVGSADLSVKMVSGDGTARIDGRLATSRIELGRMLAMADLGAVSGIFTASGIFERDTTGSQAGTERNTERNTPSTFRPLHGTLHTEESSVGFHGYTYSGLTLDGTVAGGRFGLKLSARDPALEADMIASLDRSGPTPRHTLVLDLEKADLAAMHIDIKDSISVLSGRLTADISGRTLDDANGTAELREASYRSAGGSVSTRLATLEARNSDAGKLLAFRSEFADGEARSRTGYRDMMAYLSGFLQRYIPLPKIGGSGEPLAPPDGGDPAAASNYSIITLNVKKADKLLDALIPTAAIAEGSAARFMFNPYTGIFSLSADSEFVEYRDMLAANIEVTADNAADSLTVYLSGTDIYSRRGHIPRFELYGGAKGRQRIDVLLGDRLWRIAADSVWFGSGRVGLDNLNIFSADNPGQRLTASGIVSRLSSDTLHVRLNRFDLSPLGGLLVRGQEFDMAGRATGWLDVAEVTGNPKIEADIEIRELSAQGHTAPPMRFVSRPERGGGVRFRLRNENSGDNLVYGSLSSRGEVDADVRMDSIDAALLDAFLGGVLENTRGRASARLKFGGTLRNPGLNGHIDVPLFETTVGYTRARYSVEGARLAVENSVLILPRTPVGNRLGGEGDLAMRIDMSNFRDIGVEIDAQTRGMLAFDTGPDDSEAFYGRVFATGSVGIRSSRMGTRMNISARTDAGTQFHLPLNAKSNVSWADFVVFADRRTTLDTANVLARKRLAYERRLVTGERMRRAKPLELNLTVGVTPAAEVHMLIDPNLGQGITGRGEGVIDLKINPTNDLFTMTGDYVISSGKFEFSMMNVFNKTFEIAPGSSLRWSGPPDDALLSVDASYRTRTSLLPLVGEGSGLVSGRSVPVDCIIQLRNSLSDPEITFDIAIPSADLEQRQVAEGAMNTEELKSMQFLSLLTTGSFASDNSITGQAANAGVAATGAVGFDILTNQLNNFLSSEDYDIYFRYRPQGGFATSEVDMGFSTGFLDNRLQLEIEGNWVDNRAATSMGNNNASNLVGDVSLTWAIDQAGNLRLKVFSRNIDRRDENQGLQESGLGLYYKKDFNVIGDIFRRNNSKFAPDSVTVETPRRRKNSGLEKKKQ